jgi:hypothetical protein
MSMKETVNRQYDRRQFLQVSALAAAVPGSLSPAQDPPQSGDVIHALFDRPMRWAQLAFVENDPGQYDPQFWLDYFKRTHCQGVCLSAGGIVAFYPTRIPLHYRSAWLKDSDPFGDLVRACRKLDMVIIARTDPHAVRQEVFDAHPDWIAVDAEGKKRRHWANPELWVTCALGPYNFQFMTEVHKEIMELYRVDGIFTNRWAGHGPCYCEHCRRNFKEATGRELGNVTKSNPELHRLYLVWQRGRLTELARHWDAEIRRISPEARYIPNGTPDFRDAGKLTDIQFQDKQARRGLNCPWENGMHAKQLRASMGSKPIGGIFSVGLEEQYRWKDSVQSDPEIRIWVADGVANGLRPWFTKFSATLHDRRWLKTVEEIYKWHHGVEAYLRNESPLARVALVYSEQTADYYDRGRPQQRTQEHLKGAYHALIESRIPFEMVHDGLLDPAYVDPFKLLILPNIAALSLQQCEQLRQYVKRGGNLLATFETSLYDEWGERRADFALADLFGVSSKNGIEGPMQNSYLSLHPQTGGTLDPIFRDLENASRIINGVFRLDVAPSVDFPSPVTLVPTYPDLPMEDVFPRKPKTEIRELYLRDLGGRRVAYIPWDITRVFWEILAVDHLRLFRNCVEWASNEAAPVTVTGPGVLDVAAWRQKSSMTVHLVNLTNPMLMKGPFRELIPVGAQEVRLRLPEGKRARRVQLLKAGTVPRTREENGVLTVTVPSILDLEVVAVDL